MPATAVVWTTPRPPCRPSGSIAATSRSSAGSRSRAIFASSTSPSAQCQRKPLGATAPGPQPHEPDDLTGRSLARLRAGRALRRERRPRLRRTRGDAARGGPARLLRAAGANRPRLARAGGEPVFARDGRSLYVVQFFSDSNHDGVIDASDHGVLFRVPISLSGDAPTVGAPEQLTDTSWDCQYPAPAADRLIATCSHDTDLDVYALPLDGEVPTDWSASSCRAHRVRKFARRATDPLEPQARARDDPLRAAARDAEPRHAAPRSRAIPGRRVLRGSRGGAARPRHRGPVAPAPCARGPAPGRSQPRAGTHRGGSRPRRASGSTSSIRSRRRARGRGAHARRAERDRRLDRRQGSGPDGAGVGDARRDDPRARGRRLLPARRCPLPEPRRSRGARRRVQEARRQRGRLARRETALCAGLRARDGPRPRLRRRRRSPRAGARRGQ